MILTPYFAEKNGAPNKTIFQLIDENEKEFFRAVVAIKDNNTLPSKVENLLKKIEDTDEMYSLSPVINGERFSCSREIPVEDDVVNESLVFKTMQIVTKFFQEKTVNAV